MNAGLRMELRGSIDVKKVLVGVAIRALLNKAATRSASVAGGWVRIGRAGWWGGGVIFGWGWAAGRRSCGL